LQLKQNEKYKELNNTTNANGSSSSNWQITNADILLEEKKKIPVYGIYCSSYIIP
jgi:hypothetical protein